MWNSSRLYKMHSSDACRKVLKQNFLRWQLQILDRKQQSAVRHGVGGSRRHVRHMKLVRLHEVKRISYLREYCYKSGEHQSDAVVNSVRKGDNKITEKHYAAATTTCGLLQQRKNSTLLEATEYGLLSYHERTVTFYIPSGCLKPKLMLMAPSTF